MSDTEAATSGPSPAPTQGPVPVPADSLMARMGIVLTEVTAERAVGSMPVQGNTQPFGLLHGGASAVLAETLGSYAAHLHARSLDAGASAVGIDLSITHLAGARTGTVTGTATALRLGRTVAVYVIDVTDERDRLVASARLTCAVRAGENTPVTRQV